MKQLKDMSLDELWKLFPIVLKAHNPEYQSWYRDEKNALVLALDKHSVCRINHIGSTAIEALMAKPTIDILLELSGDYDLNSIIDLMQKNNWALMKRDDDSKILVFNKGYTANGFAEKVYHLHVRSLGDWGELYFRDYLQQYADVARAYEVLKLSLKERFEHNRDAYTDAKAEFINTYTQKAREEFGCRYLPKAEH